MSASAACQQALNGVGGGIASSLRAVDCVASDMTSQFFGRLFASGGALGPALTILLTLFVAIFAIQLLLGRTSLGLRSITPRMMTLGLVLTFATSWLAYQSVVWNLFIGAPDWLATVLTGSNGSATQTFADKLDVVFTAVREASDGLAGGAEGGQDNDISAFSPAGMMWLGAMFLLLGTVGLLVTARIALAVLVGLGPIFVVMALFNGTRGLFTGWLKGLVMLALAPLFAVLGGSVMLEIAVPVLRALVATPGQVNPEAAMAFFLIGAVHVALMIMVMKVAGTMVAGWSVFGLVPDKGAKDGKTMSEPLTRVVQGGQAMSAAATSLATPRAVPTHAISTTPAANDPGGTSGNVVDRTIKVFTTSSGEGRVSSIDPGTSRTRGIGTRFKTYAPSVTISQSNPYTSSKAQARYREGESIHSATT